MSNPRNDAIRIIDKKLLFARPPVLGAARVSIFTARMIRGITSIRAGMKP
jgi:hypothetical protein